MDPALIVPRHSVAAQTMDLLDLLLDEVAAEIRGTPSIRRRGSRSYWYDRYP
jgi:hypothetical protein